MNNGLPKNHNYTWLIRHLGIMGFSGYLRTRQAGGEVQLSFLAQRSPSRGLL